MLKKIKYKNVAWVDFQNPNQEEIAKLSGEYKLHSITEEALLHLSNRSKIDPHQDYIFLTLQFPLNQSTETEIDFILGRDFIITAHHQPVKPLMEFAQILDGGENNPKKEEEFHAGHFFYYMIRELYNPLESNLYEINTQLKQAEEKIFSGNEATTVKQLSEINHRLIDIRWSLKFHAEILDILARESQQLYGEKFEHYARNIISEYKHISELLRNNQEIFSELRETNVSLLALKNATAMRNMTALAVIFLPLTLIGITFGMSGTEAIIQDIRGWFGVLFLMAVAAILAITLVKYKKWI